MQLLVMLLHVVLLQLLVRDGGRLSMLVLVGIELHVVLLLLAGLLQLFVLVGGRLMLPVLVGIWSQMIVVLVAVLMLMLLMDMLVLVGSRSLMVPVVVGKDMFFDVVFIVVVDIAATTGSGWRTRTNAIADSDGHMIAIIGDDVVGTYTSASAWHASVTRQADHAVGICGQHASRRYVCGVQ
jgi:hypothetical protein